MNYRVWCDNLNRYWDVADDKISIFLTPWGSLATFDHEDAALLSIQGTVEVDTGIRDINGRSIYVGDVIKLENYEGDGEDVYGDVIYKAGQFCVRRETTPEGLDWVIDFYDYNEPSEEMEIVGTIHDKKYRKLLGLD